MHPFERLEVAKRSRDAAIWLYKVTRAVPKDERFGITHQLRKAAVSVGANIAEGGKRVSNRDFAHFLNIAEGSSGEVRFLLDVSIGLGYLTEVAGRSLIEEYNEIERMLYALRKTL